MSFLSLRQQQLPSSSFPNGPGFHHVATFCCCGLVFGGGCVEEKRDKSNDKALVEIRQYGRRVFKKERGSTLQRLGHPISNKTYFPVLQFIDETKDHGRSLSANGGVPSSRPHLSSRKENKKKPGILFIYPVIQHGGQTHRGTRTPSALIEAGGGLGGLERRREEA